MTPDPLTDRVFAKELRRILRLPEDATNAETLAAAVEHAECMAAAKKKGAEHVLGSLGFRTLFGQAVHGGLVAETDHETLAEMHARDEAEAVAVMFTRWKEAA